MFFDYLILALVLTGVTVSLVYCLITGISPVSSTWKSRKKMIKSVSRDQDGYIYELGAGWGALAVLGYFHSFWLKLLMIGTPSGKVMGMFSGRMQIHSALRQSNP